MNLKNNKLSKVINRLALTQLVKQETRITKKSHTLLDLAITNVPHSIIRTNVSPSLADHHEITCKINIKKEKFKPIKITGRSMRSYSPEVFQNALLSIQYFNDIYKTDDINQQVNILTRGLKEALDLCAPITTTTMKKRPAKWLTEELRRNGHQLKMQRNNLKNDPFNPDELRKYKRMKKDHRKNIADSRRKQTLEDLQAQRKNPKSLWATLHSIAQNKPAPAQLNHFDDPIVAAKEFNSHYAQVGEKVFNEVSMKSNSEGRNKNYLTNDSKQQDDNCELWKPKPVYCSAIIGQIVNSLKNTNATGVDDISLKFVKDGLPILEPYLMTIINTSIATKLFPDVWKTSIIKPLYKSGDPSSPINYRPISLLPVFSKILEKFIANQLANFLETSNSLHPNQYAYRPKISTQDALLNINETIYEQIDKGNLTLLLLLDLSKAFDSVDHELLLKKLQNLSIDPQWFSSYLSNRNHAVCLQNTTSPFLPNKFGVPQGSILGPILFSIFVNDIPKMPADVTISMYADDVQIAIPFPPNNASATCKRAEMILNNLKIWYDSNGLKLNSNKTQCIIIGNHSKNSHLSNFSLTFGDSIIKPLDCVKNLGVLFDSKMTFEPHIIKTCKKVNGTLMFINRVKHLLNRKSRNILIDSLVLSNFHYCPLIWSKATKCTLHHLQKSLNFAAKVVTNGKFRKKDHVSPLLKRLQWPSIQNHLLIKEALFVHRSLKTKRSTAQLVHFTPSSLQSKRETRNFNVSIKYRKTNNGKKALSVSGAHLWNSLPNELRVMKSKTVFNKYITEHLAKGS